MGRRVQHNRGSTAEHAVFNGLIGEFTFDTERETIVAHNGRGINKGSYVLASVGENTAGTNTVDVWGLGTKLRFTSLNGANTANVHMTNDNSIAFDGTVSGTGFILTSPDGNTKVRMSVDNDGNFSVADV